MGEIFRTCPDRPWVPPSLLYKGYRVFTGGKKRPGRDADPSFLSSAVVKKRIELYVYFPCGPYGLYLYRPYSTCGLVEVISRLLPDGADRNFQKPMRIANYSAGIRTSHLRNTSVRRFVYTGTLDLFIFLTIIGEISDYFIVGN